MAEKKIAPKLPEKTEGGGSKVAAVRVSKKTAARKTMARKTMAKKTAAR